MFAFFYLRINQSCGLTNKKTPLNKQNKIFGSNESTAWLAELKYSGVLN